MSDFFGERTLKNRALVLMARQRLTQREWETLDINFLPSESPWNIHYNVQQSHQQQIN